MAFSWDSEFPYWTPWSREQGAMLPDLLSKAVARPDMLPRDDVGAAIALSLHCEKRHGVSWGNPFRAVPYKLADGALARPHPQACS